jgi:hypothetical protein
MCSQSYVICCLGWYSVSFKAYVPMDSGTPLPKNKKQNPNLQPEYVVSVSVFYNKGRN